MASPSAHQTETLPGKYAAVGDLIRMSTQTPRGPQVAYFCPDPAAGREELPLVYLC